MPATAPAKPSGSASKSSSSSASKSSSSSSKKSTARSTSQATSKRVGPGKAVLELRSKRADFEQPIVDTPVAAATGGETLSIDGKDKIEITPQGSSVDVIIGGKTVTVDREGVHSLQRHLDQIAVGM